MGFPVLDCMFHPISFSTPSNRFDNLLSYSQCKPLAFHYMANKLTISNNGIEDLLTSPDAPSCISHQHVYIVSF